MEYPIVLRKNLINHSPSSNETYLTPVQRMSQHDTRESELSWDSSFDDQIYEPVYRPTTTSL